MNNNIRTPNLTTGIDCKTIIDITVSIQYLHLVTIRKGHVDDASNHDRSIPIEQNLHEQITHHIASIGVGRRICACQEPSVVLCLHVLKIRIVATGILLEIH